MKRRSGRRVFDVVRLYCVYVFKGSHSVLLMMMMILTLLLLCCCEWATVCIIISLSHEDESRRRMEKSCPLGSVDKCRKVRESECGRTNLKSELNYNDQNKCINSYITIFYLNRVS